MVTLEKALGFTVKRLAELIEARIGARSRYFGVEILKCPLDLWVYQELVCALRPNVVVEVGTHCGGTALFLAHLFDQLKSGRVVSVDRSLSLVHPSVRSHNRIALVEGDAVAAFAAVRSLVRPRERAWVIEDSSHEFGNTLAVLRTYSALVCPGGYFIVEDGICHHGLDEGPSPGPYEAVEAFLGENGDFAADRSLESFVLTWNPGGFLRRR